MAESFDILRQSGWGAWGWVCLAAAAVLLIHAIVNRPSGWLPRGLIAFGIFGTILIAAIPPLHEALVGLLWTLLLMGTLSAVFYLTLRDRLPPRRLLWLFGLRLGALAMLTPMLFEPVWRFVQPPAPQRPLSFLIDTSGSMSVADVPNAPTRIQSVWQTLAPQLSKLDAHFLPRFYSFSTTCTRLSRPEDLEMISADGQSTDFAAAVNTAAADTPGDLVLISDGNDNVSPDVVDLLGRSGRKVHTLSVGSTLAEPRNFVNVAVDSVQAPAEIVAGHEAKLTATIKNTALANRIVDVNLSELDPSDKPIGPITHQRLVLQQSPDGQTVDLAYTPSLPGVHHLAVWIDPIPGERTVADNRQEIQVLAIQGRIKVLYIEGALRPEYKYLNLMMGHDADLELATLLRLQRDRFIAAGTVDGDRFTALPATPQEWNRFDVILIGDLDASFLTTAQQSMIRQRVSDGGGLVMIGGQQNFGAGGYQNTPLEEVLPVFVGDPSIAQEKEEFVPRLTPEGLAHPIFQNLTDWFPTASAPAKMQLSPLKGNVVVSSPKAGAQVLLVHAGRPEPDGADEIVLAVQQYGKGRSAAFTADTTNVWYRQFRGQGQGSAYNRFWAQLLAWLAGQDVRNREKGPGVDALINKSVYPFGDPVQVRAIVRDEHGDTTQFAQVTARLSGPGLPATDFPLAAATGRAGEYQLVLPPPGSGGLKPGQYSLQISAAKENALLGRQTLDFSVIPPEDEMLKIAADPQRMEQIASATLGYHRPLAELPELLDTLIATDPTAGQSVQRTLPLANTLRVLLTFTGHDPPWPAHSDLPMEGALVIGLLMIEWVLRRKWQVP